VAAVAQRLVVCPVDDLPPGGRKVVDAGPFGIGVFNVNGRYYALNNYCPHRGGPLCLGEITGTTEETPDREVVWTHEGEVLRCPWHNWEFVIESGRTVSEPAKHVKMYPVSVEDGQVVLDLPSRLGDVA